MVVCIGLRCTGKKTVRDFTVISDFLRVQFPASKVCYIKIKHKNITEIFFKKILTIYCARIPQAHRELVLFLENKPLPKILRKINT